MFNKFINIKNDITNNKELISKKIKNIETKKKEIKEEKNKWGKKQVR